METFAKWKKERLDKKAAEEEAKMRKDATGRAMFEKGDWAGSDDESDDEGEGNEWNLETMRRETELARARKEEERLAAKMGISLEELRIMEGTNVPTEANAAESVSTGSDDVEATES